MRAIFLSLCFVLFLLPSGMAAAQDDIALPQVENAPCQTSECLRSALAKRIGRVIPPYSKLAANDNIEGFVSVQYTVGIDGHVKDIKLAELIGPRYFADATIETVQNWTFTPGLADGKAVEQTFDFSTIFNLRNGGTPGARGLVINAYGKAVGLLREGKFDEAEAILKAVEAEPKLNFYERGMLGNAAALIAISKGEYVRAQELLRIPTDYYAWEFPPAVLKTMLATRVGAAVGAGNLAAALVLATRYSKMSGVKADDPLLKQVAEMKAGVDAAPSFAMQGEVPQGQDISLDSFITYYSGLTFTNIVGSLDSMVIQCRSRTVKSKIVEKVEWRIPKDWGNCQVTITGAPRTKYQVVQFKD